MFRAKLIIVLFVFFSISTKAQNFSDLKGLLRIDVDTLTIPQKRYSLLPHQEPARKTIGVALSGGGARGVAQIGVLKAFEEKKIPIDFIVGTSMGAIIGGLHASGYSPQELEELVKVLSWDELTALQETNRRRELFLEQKRVRDRASLTLQFDGLTLIIPKSLSSAQELTKTLDKLLFAAPYINYGSFDDLPISFSAVATNLVTGKREVIQSGLLSEAIRASAAVPLLFLPVEIEGKQLVDGGLVSNIGVDVLLEKKPDISIAVNTLGTLYRKDSDVDLPWRVADQIMGIMMQEQNQLQLSKATIEIKPDLESHESGNFNNLSSLINAGYQAGLQMADSIHKLMHVNQSNDKQVSTYQKIVLNNTLSGADFSRVEKIIDTGEYVKATLAELLKTDFFTQAYAELDTVTKKVYYHLSPLPDFKHIKMIGATTKSGDTLVKNEIPLNRNPTNKLGIRAIEQRMGALRKEFPLARLKGIEYESEQRNFNLFISEEKAADIQYKLSRGWTRTSSIMREIEIDTSRPLAMRDIDKTIYDLYNTGIFNRVSIGAKHALDSSGNIRSVVELKLNEKFSELLRIGFRIDDIYASQMLLDFRNENFLGTASELGGWFTIAERISSVQVEYRAHRLWDTYYTFFTKLFYNQRKLFSTSISFSSPNSTPDRKELFDYGQQHFGISAALGKQIYRDGSIIFELTHQNTRLYDNTGVAPNQNLTLTSLKARFTLDTRDNVISTTRGNFTDIYFDYTPVFLGNPLTFSRFLLSHQETRPFSDKMSGRLRLNLGFSDNLTPFTEQFSLGGAGASFSIPFYGLRFDDFRGRQVVVAGYDLEFLLPVKLVVPTLFGIHYNIGNIWSVSSRIALREFTHGVGGELILRTPIGAARLAIAKSFRLGLPTESTLFRFAPTVYYFIIGYEL